MIALRTSIVAGFLLAFASHASAALQPVKTTAPQQTQQCRWETPAQFGPRASPRAPVWTCASAAERKPRCGHYELNLPIWAVGRALPPVRTWVSERCPSPQTPSGV
jgi:hypothetical protein